MASEKSKKFDKASLRLLKRKAKDFIRSPYCNMTKCHAFYRSKPKEYFDAIYIGDGNMKVVLKDKSGDPRNPINRKLKGLFFMANMHKGNNYKGPPPSSPFGDRMFRVPPQIMFNPSKHNMYFADFYCMYNAHYVTLIITNRRSDADDICQVKLLNINMENNQFLMINDNSILVSKVVWVEIFYTEDIPFREWLDSIPDCNLEDVEQTGHGPTPGGLVKNPTCKICNI